jgi:hypothetical protein
MGYIIMGEWMTKKNNTTNYRSEGEDLFTSPSPRLRKHHSFSASVCSSQEIPVSEHQSLWRAVIMQALMDAATRSRKPEALYHKREAYAWLTEGSRDFVMVCDYANLDPGYVRIAAKHALARGCAWRSSVIPDAADADDSPAEPEPAARQCTLQEVA